MTTSRTLAAATAVAVPLALLSVSGAEAGARAKTQYLPAKNTVYKGANTYPSDLVYGNARIKVGKNKKKLTKVTIRFTCPQGDEKVVFKAVPYRAAGYQFYAVKGSKSKPTHELFITFPSKKRADGDLWFYSGPCKGYRWDFFAER